jgi:hypothetical protein
VCKSSPNGSTEAEALWCLPWTDIRVFPVYFDAPQLDSGAG